MFKNSFYCLAYQLRYLIRQFVASLCHLVMLCLFFCRRVIRSDCALYGFPEIPLKKILNNLENFSVPIELYKNHALLVTFFLIRLTLEFCMEASETSVYAFTAAVFFFFFSYCNVLQCQVIYLQKTICTLLQQCNFSSKLLFFF